MRLKSLELNGFKTFATKSVFEFDEKVTAIVGPNGSGKSNIADAVRWVLGEQSYKLLRGRKTVDMIFSGSDERSRAGMASVTIVFDNSEEWLPIDFSEVSITRRAYRDGQNEYFVNGQKILLRDVNELLGQSGLSERTYTIIGQGLVDAALALNAEERRSLFEEAAGIGLYQSRRAEAEKRLEKTRRNLDRVDDIIAELEPRLRSLKRQAQRAEKYNQVKADLEMLMREWYGFHWSRVQGELSAARAIEENQRQQLAQSRANQASLDQSLSEFQINAQGLRARLNSWHRQLSQHHAKREHISRDLAVSDERLRSLKIQSQGIATERARAEEQASSHQERLETAESEVQRLEADLSEAHSRAEEARQSLRERQREQNIAQQKLSQAQKQRSQLEDQRYRLRARSEESQTRIEHQNQALTKIDQKIAQAETNAQQAQEKLTEAKKNREQALIKHQGAEKTLEEHRQKITTVEKHRQTLREKLSDTKTDISQLQAELRVLEQAEKKLTGYASGARTLLKGARAGKLLGAMGALSSYLEVEEIYETAIAAALGEYLDAVVLEKAENSESALEILLHEATRGALLPLNALVPPEPIKAKENIPGLLGLASNLVQSPPKLHPAVDLLLGQVFVVRDRESVRRTLAGQPAGAKAVTLQGEVFYATGQIFAGQGGEPSTLSRSRQLRDAQEKLSKAQEHAKKLQQELARVDIGLEQLRAQGEELLQALTTARKGENSAEDALNQAALAHDKARQQAAWERSQRQNLREEITSGETAIAQNQEKIRQIEAKIAQSQELVRELNNALGSISLQEKRRQVSHWDTQAAVAKRALAGVEERRDERWEAWREAQKRAEALTRQQKALAEEKDALHAKKEILQKQEAEIAGEIKTVRELIEPTEAALAEAEEQQKNLRISEAEARKELNLAERRYVQAQLALTRAKENLETMQERIKEDIGLVELTYEADVSGPKPLPLEGWVEKLPVVEEISEGLGDTIREQRAQLRRLGAINPEAQTEYHEVTHRFEFMTEQLSDLRKAEADIKEVIAELELLTERDFRKTFDAVASEFRAIFTRLFGGGEAKLVLTDPSDLTRSGVDIEARLPGRRSQGLSLLSGGERSLTAAALIFAILKVSPTPFCVLDEVDAMLDEANVARYRDLMRELSADTQFIVITHNRNTVQAADVIYGITMAQDSTSQTLSLKLDEVADVIE